MRSIENFLRNRHPFDTLEAETFQRVFAKTRVIEVKQDDLIYQFDEQLSGLYLIFSGEIEVKDGKGDLLSRLGVGQFFGERGLLKKGCALSSARAEVDSTLIEIEAGAFLRLVDETPRFKIFFKRSTVSKDALTARTAPNETAVPISELMSSPVITISSEVSIHEAAKIMRGNHISCLCVENSGGELIGILTLRDLVYKGVSEAISFEATVGDIMTTSPMSIGKDSLVVDALLLMTEKRIGHLPVFENERLVGILTKSNLVSRNALSPISLVIQISKAETSKEMKEIVSDLPRVLAQLAGAGTAPHIIMRLLTDVSDACTRRLIALFERENGAAPARFVWGACGSQGRQEQTGVSDQDNCIIFDDRVEDTLWFENLARFTCDGLDHIGYFNCPGDMMATNSKWCQPVHIWREYFMDWIERPTGEAQMLASVMFDLRAIYGDKELLEDMRVGVLEAASENSIFLNFLLSNAVGHQPPLSMFRGFSTIRSGDHKDTIDLKHNGVVPITDLARVFAIKAQVAQVNTRERLELAGEKGGVSQKGAEDMIAAYDLISELRLRHQMRQIRRGERPDNFLAPDQLTELERSHLRNAFVMVKSLQNAVSRGILS